MDDSDSDSSVERFLNKNYDFLRNSCITTDPISTNSTTTSQAAPENGLESQVEQDKVTDTKPTDTRYDNLTLEELNNIAERIKIYHEVGVVVPEKIVSCQNKYKRKNNKKTEKMQQSIRKKKTTFGQGRIGTTCSTFGVKRCLCCNVDKENCGTVGEQNGCLIDGNNCNSLRDRFTINELIQRQLESETSQSDEDQELDRLTRTENEQPSTFQSCERKRARKRSPIRPATNSESTMSQLINLRGHTVQKTVENYKSPLRESKGDGLVTSTPSDIHSSHQRNRINSCNNFLDISAIGIGETEPDVECVVEESQTTTEIVQNNGNNDAGKEEDIMEYVNGLLGTTADTIAEEVEERYQRLDESRRAVSDAISNAISSNHHEVVHEEMDLEPSVILVSVGSPQPILVEEDSIIQINELDDTTRNVEETVTSIGMRTRKRGMISASSSNVKKTCGVFESTREAEKQQPSGSRVAISECSICLESLSKREISATTCGHVFCTECIKAAIRTCRMCPNCRTHLTLKKIHPLYL